MALVTFVAGGGALGARAVVDASHSSLRAVFDGASARERAVMTEDGRAPPEDVSVQAILTGMLRDDAAASSGGVLLRIEAERLDMAGARTPVAGGVTAVVIGELAAGHFREWRAGRRIRAPVQLRRLSRYLDPGVVDQETALARQGIVLAGTIKSGALVEVIARGSPLAEAAAAVREHVRAATAAVVAPWSAQSAAIVNAIVIGDRAGIDPGVERRLQDAGTYHVIAISGGNIAILAGVLLTGFRVAGLLGPVAMIAAAAALALYAYLVGGGASVDRATLMAVVYFAARTRDLRSPPVNVLALVAAVAVALDPGSIAEPAFVLTFGATLAILVVMPRVGARTLPRRVAPVVGLGAASLATELMLFPAGAAFFQRITVAGLALNFLAIPLMALAQLAGMALAPLVVVSMPAAHLVGWLAHVGAAGLVWSATLVRFAPLATWRTAAPAAWTLVLYYGGIGAAAWCWWRSSEEGSAVPRVIRHGGRAAFALAGFAGLWIAAAPWTLVTTRGDGRLHATFIDVGQGDSALIRFPNGRAWLIDAGGLGGASSFDIGDRVVAPVLRTVGVRRLDTVVLTHGDPDHIGGAASIVREFKPRVVAEGIPVPRSEALASLKAASIAAGASWIALRTGNRFAVGDVEVVVRHPDEADWERQKVRNDDSVVLEILWRGVSVLLTGDIGQAVEPTIAASLAPGRVRVIKVPHHGSQTSSTRDFIAAAHPAIAVFSVGRANHFGHPALPVVDRYRAAGSEILRTDRDGAVDVETDGRSLTIATFTGRRLIEPR